MFLKYDGKRNNRRCGRTDGLDDKMQYKDIALLL